MQYCGLLAWNLLNTTGDIGRVSKSYLKLSARDNDVFRESPPLQDGRWRHPGVVLDTCDVELHIPAPLDDS